MENLNLAQLISTTPYDFARSAQKDRAGLEATLAENEYKKSLTDQQRFQTERGQALLPTDLLGAQQKTDPRAHESSILKGESEATVQSIAAQKALRMQSKEDWEEQHNLMFTRGEQLVEAAIYQSMLGKDPKDFIPQLVTQLMKDPEKGAELSTMLQPYMDLPREEFIKQATSMLQNIRQVRTSLDPAQMKALALAQTKEATSSDAQLAADIKKLHPGDSPAQIQARINELKNFKVDINAASIPRETNERKGMGIDPATGLPFTVNQKSVGRPAAAAPQPVARTPATSAPTATGPVVIPQEAFDAEDARRAKAKASGKQ